MDSTLGLIALSVGAFVVLGGLVLMSLRASNEAFVENQLFTEAKALGFYVEDFGARRLRAQFPLLGIPAARTRRDGGRRWGRRRYGVPYDPEYDESNPFRDLHDHPDPAMRAPGSSRRPGEVYFPAAWRDANGESVTVFLLPTGQVLHADGRPRVHDELVFAVNPHGAALVPTPDPELVARLERDHGWSAEAQGAWLLVYRAEPCEPPPNLEAFLTEAHSIARRIL